MYNTRLIKTTLLVGCLGILGLSTSPAEASGANPVVGVLVSFEQVRSGGDVFTTAEFDTNLGRAVWTDFAPRSGFTFHGEGALHFSGEGVMEFEGGDTIWTLSDALFAFKAHPGGDLDPAVSVIQMNITITGGTGAFEGAAGTANSHWFFDQRSEDDVEATFKGVIVLH